MHYLKENCPIVIKIVSNFKFVLKGPIDSKSALVQVMTLHQSNVDPVLWHHMLLLDHTELKKFH